MTVFYVILGDDKGKTSMTNFLKVKDDISCVLTLNVSRQGILPIGFWGRLTKLIYVSLNILKIWTFESISEKTKSY